jgi:predicted nucleic acid-binding protein
VTRPPRTGLGEILRRHDPAAWTTTLAYRPRADLPFDAAAIDPAAPVMLDTTVYIDALKSPGLPPPVATVIARNIVLHAAITRTELALSLGHLDPAHPMTARNAIPLRETLLRMAPSRIFAPSADAWTEASLIAGILARIQGRPREARRALLNDALLLLTAIEQRAVLISRNITDMDLLLRFRPDAQILLYDRA